MTKKMSDEEFLKLLESTIGFGTKEEAEAKALGDFSKSDKIPQFTQLFEDEPELYTDLWVDGVLYQYDFFTKSVETFMLFRKSLNAWQGNGFIKILASSQQAKKGIGFISKLFGRKPKEGPEEKEI